MGFKQPVPRSIGGRSGNFVTASPSRASRWQKRPPCCRPSPRDLWLLRVEMLIPSAAGASILCLAKGATGKSPLSAGGPLGNTPVTQSLKSEIQPPREDSPSGQAVCCPCENEATLQITGSSKGAARQAEIDQPLQRFKRGQRSDNTRLSDIPQPLRRLSTAICCPGREPLLSRGSGLCRRPRRA